MSKRFIMTILTLVVIAATATIAVFFAKGYRFSTQTGTLSGTGILSITSVPDQASVYLDNHLTTATNANINSLLPKSYQIKIIKEGFITWEKKAEVKEGLVTEIKATLFRAIPSVYPLTYTGATNLLLSPDGENLAFVVPFLNSGDPQQDKKAGIWIWSMAQKPIAFSRGSEPHQIATQASDIDLGKAKFKFSPDSSQLLVSLPDRHLLLGISKLNDPPRDITALFATTMKSWDEDAKAKETTRSQLIRDVAFRKTASSAAYLKWAPDETKLIYSVDGKKDFKIVDLVNKKTYDMPQANYLNWLPDSEHLIIVEEGDSKAQKLAKIAVIEYDGSNKSEIYAGSFDAKAVFAWPDSSRLVIVSSLPTPTASQPNLFGINLK